MNSESDRDLWTDYCRRLHRHYHQSNLRILLGNGLSVASKFPSWDDLNRDLLERFIKDSLLRDDQTRELIATQIPALTTELYNVIGRDAAADFVWHSNTRDDFFELLTHALYGDRTLTQLPLRPVHYQLAAMNKAKLFTTNFDPLLELGIQRVFYGEQTEPDPAPFRRTSLAILGEPLPAHPVVCHLHGWIDPDGFRGGSFVLTQAQYFEVFQAENKHPNQILTHILTSGGAVLILGMSLVDMNLRRQLYLRSQNQMSDSTEIYAILKTSGTKLLDEFQCAHWASRGVRLAFIKDYDDIPSLLREIKFGMPKPKQPFPWIKLSREWRETRVSDTVLCSDRWQAFAHTALVALRDRLLPLFASRDMERISVAFVLPVSEVEIAYVADSRRLRSGLEAQQLISEFRLRIESETPQGITGVAFSQCKPYQILNNMDAAERNFTPEMRVQADRWGLADWQSLIAIPILETPDRLPVAVVAIGSNLLSPFWADLSQTNQRAHGKFVEMVQQTAMILMTPPHE